MTTSTIPTIKTALVTILTALLPDPVWVGYGHPGTLRIDDMVAVMDARATQVVGPMGSNRVRDETVTVEITFSTYRGGNDQPTTTARVFTMLGLLETSLRSDPTLGLGITLCRGAQVSDIALAELAIPEGRVAEIAVTVTAICRLN